MQKITSSNNPLIKEIKSLERRKNRWDGSKFIIEGIKLIEEALESKASLLRIILTDSLKNTEQGEMLYNRIKNLNEIVYLPQTLFDTISNVENSQGIIGIVAFNPLGLELLPSDGLILYLDGLQDPGNMGTIIRSADAFGIRGIVIGNKCVDPYNPKVVRATMGSIFRVSLYFEKNHAGYFEDIFRERRIIATSLKDATSLNDLKFSCKDVIVVGNEGNGVSFDIIERSDVRVIIPMKGDAESLNAGVAASILMYESSRQMIK
ncbi:TrmH family RNA methyltransferase [Gudongella sp. DL1XJH-153]|uniref:TrmH family RNA methyltransferase n=1 Tax=Gudongella sp. DL1XJH-153 TaxID=3409804 RepID=UPI003BB56820